MVWSIKTLEKEKAEPEGDDFGQCKAFIFVIWQMFTLTSRLSAIVIVGYVFRYGVFFLAGHWLLLVLYYVYFQRPDVDAWFLEIIFLVVLETCPSLFHSISLEGILPNKSPKVIYMYIFIVVENIFMVILSVTIAPPDTKRVDVLKPTALGCLVGGTVLPFFSFVYYNKLYKCHL